jgi:hypothetical protein
MASSPQNAGRDGTLLGKSAKIGGIHGRWGTRNLPLFA